MKSLPSTVSTEWWWRTAWRGLVQLGIRQSRYFGRIKTRFQLYLAATVVNLTLVAAKSRVDGREPAPVPGPAAPWPLAWATPPPILVPRGSGKFGPSLCSRRHP